MEDAKNTKVISVGGSIIAPDRPDIQFLSDFVGMVSDWLDQNQDAYLVLVAGGGAPAREYQEAYRLVSASWPASLKPTDDLISESADLIGVAATRMNAELLAASFGRFVTEPVVTNPTQAPDDWQKSGRVLVASGWKPGFSSDFDAVVLAEKYGAREVINLSNTDHVYSADPKKDPNARPLDQISWADFRKMVGETWQPGLNMPFDPIASARAEMIGLKVICAKGTDIANTRAILDEKPFSGTTIGA